MFLKYFSNFRTNTHDKYNVMQKKQTEPYLTRLYASKFTATEFKLFFEKKSRKKQFSCWTKKFLKIQKIPKISNLFEVYLLLDVVLTVKNFHWILSVPDLIFYNSEDNNKNTITT